MSLLRHGSSRCFTQLPLHSLLRCPRAAPRLPPSQSTATTSTATTAAVSPFSSQLGSSRKFHALTAFNNATVTIADTIASIHHIAGLPWYITIPLVAVGINLSVRLPLSYLTRRRAARMKELGPLLSAWAIRARAAPGATPTESRRVFLQSSRRIYTTFGVQRWKTFLSILAPIAPFVLVSVALRRLSGSYGMSFFAVSSTSASTTTEAGAAASAAAAIPVDPVFDPSLAHGGLLWFTDLTAADPYYVLPIMCSATLAANLWLNMPASRLRSLLIFEAQQGTSLSDSRLGRALGRLSLLMPLFPLMMGYLPSAIMLYWFSNFSLTVTNELIVRRLVKSKPPRAVMPEQDDDMSSRVMPYLPAEYPEAGEASVKAKTVSSGGKKVS